QLKRAETTLASTTLYVPARPREPRWHAITYSFSLRSSAVTKQLYPKIHSVKTTKFDEPSIAIPFRSTTCSSHDFIDYLYSCFWSADVSLRLKQS
ncbi:jg4161, partial [Pararge aegeria aegeria]